MSQTIYIVLCKRRKAQLLEVIATERERGGERERGRERETETETETETEGGKRKLGTLSKLQQTANAINKSRKCKSNMAHLELPPPK